MAEAAVRRSIWVDDYRMGGILAAGVALLSTILAVVSGPLWLFTLLLVPVAFIGYPKVGHSLRLRRVERRPFPDQWRRILVRQVPWYRHLSEARRRSFETNVALFLEEHTFRGEDGVAVTDELKLLAAASAVLLSFGTERSGTLSGRPLVCEIVFHPHAISDPNEPKSKHRKLAGQYKLHGLEVHLSVPALREGFAELDGYHPGLHEFAHALDISRSRYDGVPRGMAEPTRQRWKNLMAAEMQRAKRGESALRKYAGTGEAEFFACAVEMFFEEPNKLAKDHPEMYDILSEYFAPQKT